MQPHDKAILWGSNESDYRTPQNCYKALTTEFVFVLDAAANYDNAKTGQWLGPGSPLAENALAADWCAITRELVDYDHSPLSIFLNPPFSKTLVNAYNTGRTKRDGQWVEHPIDREMAKCYDVGHWARKCWEESQKGATIVGIFPFAPQTDWYRHYVYGHVEESISDGRGERDGIGWSGHCAREERRLPHRISFLTPEGEPTGNAGVNSVILVWKPNYGIVGPYQPSQFYWSYREAA